MALHESALEEFGLAPLWVRRGSASASAALQDGQVDAAADAAFAGDDVPGVNASPDVARSGEAPAAAVTPSASPAQRGGPRETPRSVQGGEREPAAERSAHAAPPAPPEDGFAWFDDLPTRPSSRVPAPATDDARNPATDDAAMPPVATLDWDALVARVAGCERCRLCEKRTQTVFGVGDRHADWMLIGEAPGENEDRQGEPFVGQAGKLLDNMLRSLSLARGENVYIANVLKCRPPGNRNPEPDEVARCAPYLQRQVALVKPKLIVALGRFAAQSLLKTDASISSLRGRVHTYEGVPVIVTYHPAYLLRSLQDKAKAWQDLCLARDTWRNAGTSAEEGAPPQLAAPSADRSANPAANPAADSATD
jgi:uracil-DNA glycosylase